MTPVLKARPCDEGVTSSERERQDRDPSVDHDLQNVVRILTTVSTLKDTGKIRTSDFRFGAYVGLVCEARVNETTPLGYAR